MPKAASTQVIIHRIEFQETERRLLENIATSYSVRNVSKSIFNLTSDTTTVILLMLLFEAVTGKEIIDDVFLTLLGEGKEVYEVIATAFSNWRASTQASQDYTAYGEAALSFWDRLFTSLGFPDLVPEP